MGAEKQLGGWRLEHSYAELPARMFTASQPAPVRAPKLVLLNAPLAVELGLEPEVLSRPENAGWFVGNALPPGAAPIAQSYAGHQYGNFVNLGDGRAILLGEQITPRGERFDVQLKGPGRTRYSRGGDGRAALGPMLREYIISEAMRALGIPTTRSLAVAATGEPVQRETVLPGAILTRVAASHIRVGTFEFAAATGEIENLRAIADYTLRRHYPEHVEAEQPYAALLRAVLHRQAALIARWQMVGFVHGVMNTDNMALSGETIDYGPCAFMDAYHEETVFSSIDRHGRYAYGNQPPIAHWNLSRLAAAMLPLLHAEQERAVGIANEILEEFADAFEGKWLEGFRAKVGLRMAEEGDAELIGKLLAVMQEQRMDFTNTFRDLSKEGEAACGKNPLSEWMARWEERVKREPILDEIAVVQNGDPLTPALSRGEREKLLAAQDQSTSIEAAAGLGKKANGVGTKTQTGSVELRQAKALMRATNPAFIPRNHKVEEALASATGGDLGPLEKLLAVVAAPFEYGAELPEYGIPAEDSGVRYQTFCGT